MIIEPYPHVIINVEDRTPRDVFQTDFMPLARHLILLKAQKGEPFEPEWCELASNAYKKFGRGTFDPTNKKYFSQSAYFANTVFESNGCFLCRMIDKKNAKPSFLIVEVYLRHVKDFNETEDGTEIMWKTRSELLENEDINNLDKLQSRKVTENEVTWDVSPIMAFKSTSPGEHGDNTGFQFFFDRNQNNRDIVEDELGALLLTFAPIEKPTNNTNIVPIRDKFNNPSVSFTIKEDVINKTTQSKVSAKEVIEDSYPERYALPYEIYFYDKYYHNVGDEIRKWENAARPEQPEYLANAYLVNALDLIDYRVGEEFEYIRTRFNPVDASPVHMKLGVNHKLGAGDDGDMSDSMIESQMIDWLNFRTNPNIVDVPRYPFTHLPDAGYHIETKKALIDFQDKREEVKSIISTQQVTDAEINGQKPKNTPNTKAEDYKIGSALRAYALAKRESIVKGTEACRTTIFMQCGKPHSSLYTGWLPATLWAAAKRAEMQNRDFMDREPKGLPLSDISIFKKVNWVAHAEDTKRMAWNAGLNYFQFYDMKRMHYAALRTVYPHETSSLIDDTFTDAIIYTKYLIRDTWAIFSGLQIESDVLHERVESTLRDKLDKVLNGKYRFAVRAYQNATEAELGYVHHVAVTLYADTTARVFNVDIICERTSSAPNE